MPVPTVALAPPLPESSIDIRGQLQQSLGTAYTVERELGGGGMSRVFLAFDPTLGRQIVVKVLSSDLAASVSVERFRREIKLAATLQHPHIVPLLTAGELAAQRGEPPLPYYTMPRVDGESLRERLTRGELPVPDAIRVLRDIADALAFAHERGVVHRDVKPENVLVASGHALVIDFGVAKAVQDSATSGGPLTTVGIALGTPAYMAPEQAAADPMTDHRADIYAFGIVAYEVLTGRAPFYGRSAAQLLAAHAIEQPTPIEQVRSSVPPALAALVTQCLAKRPADRPQSARELVSVLESLGTPGLGSAPSGSASTRRTASPRGVLVAAAAGLVAVAVLVAWQRLRAPSLSSRRVAVAPFENLTGDTALAQVGRIAADWITQGAAQLDSLDVVPSTTVSAALAATGAGAARGTDVVRRLAAATHAGVVVTGVVTLTGDSLRVSASIVDARRDRPIRAIEAVAGPVSDPLIAISALRDRLLGSLASGEETRGVALAGEAPKYEAYRAMMDGWDHSGRGDYKGALPSLRRALQLDSNFVLAHIALALAYGNQGMVDSSERVIGDVDRLRDRMSVMDKLQVDAHKANLAGDAEAELGFIRQIIARDSEPSWLVQAGFSALKQMRAYDAVAFLRAPPVLRAEGGVARGPNTQIFLALGHHELGDFADQLSTLERGRRLFPANRLFAAYELIAFAGLHRPAAALALADTLLAGATGADVAPLGWAVAGAYDFGAHGDTATGQLLAQKVITWDAAHAGPARPAREINVGSAWLLFGHLDSASARYRRAARDTSTVRIAGFNAMAAAMQGDTSRARATADSLGAVRAASPRLAGECDFWRAAIDAQVGDREQAVALLRQSAHEGQVMAGWHSDGMLRALRGYPPFEQLIAPKQ